MEKFMPIPDWNTVLNLYEMLGKAVPKDMIWKLIKNLKTNDPAKLLALIRKALRIP